MSPEFLTQPESVTDKIEKLNQEAWDVRVSDPTQAKALSEEAIELPDWLLKGAGGRVEN
jgi:hypothetical protein